MGIWIRVLVFLVLSGAIWAGDSWAQRNLIERGQSSEAVAAVNGDEAAEMKIEVRQQRQTALMGAGVAANFFAAIACFATFRRKPTQVIVDRRNV